jgi:phage-related baseplate assembly protein
MAGSTTAVDLSLLSPPDVVEQIDFEVILAAALEDYYAKMDALGIEYTRLRESDPAYKLAEAFAYREMLVRQRANDSAKAVLLAYAKGNDLEHKAAERNLQRRVITPATEIEPAVMETDETLRARVQLAPEGYTTAGSEGSYIFHGMNADVRVKDIQPDSPTPGIVNIYVLSTEGNGTASEELLTIVENALNKKEVRPLTDSVNIFSASIITYEVTAVLQVEDGPDDSVILADALAQLSEYTSKMHALGRSPTLSGIYQALHRPGVSNVVLTSPASNLAVSTGQAAYCNLVNVTTVRLGA